ncbi:MAG TPA: transporter [Noviherbaspirillum sp.]|nr:transporter [Noviherbaspirillum sp.]
MRGCLSALLLCGLAPVAYATHPLVSDDPNTQSGGHHQIEANTDWARQDEVHTHVGALTYSYGAQDNLDLYLNIPLTFTAPSGINDVGVGAKWRFLENETMSSALKPELQLPTGDEARSLGNGRTSARLTAIVAYDAQPWRLLGNLGLSVNRYRLQADRDTRRGIVWHASASLWYSLSDQWKLLSDIGADSDVDKASYKHPGFVLAGVMYSPAPNLDLDAGVRFDLRCSACSALSNRQVGVGVAARF